MFTHLGLLGIPLGSHMSQPHPSLHLSTYQLDCLLTEKAKAELLGV